MTVQGTAGQGSARRGKARHGGAGQGKGPRASSTSRAAKPGRLNMAKEYRRELREIAREERGISKTLDILRHRKLVLQGRLSS